MNVGVFLDWLSANSVAVAVVLLATVVLLHALRRPGGPYEPLDESNETAGISKVGEVTLEQLQGYDGRDPTLPLLLAVRGVVFDVSKGRDFYGPGAGYGIFAGRECSRALAKMSLKEEDISGDLSDVTEEQLGYLKEWEDKFNEKYPVVGSVISSRQFTPDKLAAHDGRDQDKPILLAVRGLVFDVSKGRDFYGPDGAYPFSGKEVARALAKTSLDPKDFNADLEGLSQTEIKTLSDWEIKFRRKYKIVGSMAPN